MNTPPPYTVLLLSTLGTLLIGVAAIVTVWISRKKNKLETNVLIANYYKTTFDELRTQIDELREEVRKLRDNEKVYQDTIAGYASREKGYQKRIAELESLQLKLITPQTTTP